MHVLANISGGGHNPIVLTFILIAIGVILLVNVALLVVRRRRRSGGQ
jgi:hypothetical protein